MKFHWQICFPILLVFLYFNAVLFGHAEDFYFDEVPFVYSYLFISLAVQDILVKILLRGMSEIFLTMFSSRTPVVS